MKTHELRLEHFDIDKNPALWTTVEHQGSYQECYNKINQIGYDKGFPNGNCLLSNGGYKIVSLKEEREGKIKKAGIELYEALIALYDWSRKINTGDEGDQAQQLAEKALKKANPFYEQQLQHK